MLLARGAAAGSGAAALEGALGAQTPLGDPFQIAVCHAEIPALFGNYVTILEVVSRGLVGLFHGPWPKQNQQTLTLRGQHYGQIARSSLLGSGAAVKPLGHSVPESAAYKHNGRCRLH